MRVTVRHIVPVKLLAVQFVSGFSVALKDAVKGIPGTRWEPVTKSWMVPEVAASSLMRVLSGIEVACDDSAKRVFETVRLPSLEDATKEALRNDSSSVATEELEERETSLELRMRREVDGSDVEDAPVYSTISAFHARVSASLFRTFAAKEWVAGVVTDLKTSSSGGIYLTLSDPDEIRGSAASLNVTLFPYAADKVRRTLHAAGLSLATGMTLALGGKVSVYAQRSSIQLLADDVDPRVSRGELELQRERVVKALREAGLSQRNAMIPFPELPRRIAVVTSVNGEAWHDLQKTLRSAGVGVELDIYDANVQGTLLEPTVLNAFSRLRGRRDLDLVVVIRGGGAANELAWWDNLKVATAVAECPIPVLVGIGHQRDETALHEVARFEATPTAVGDRIVRLWLEARSNADAYTEILRRVGTQRLQEASRSFEIRSERFRAVALRAVDRERSKVERELPRAIGQAWERGRAQRAMALDFAKRGIESRAQRHLETHRRAWTTASERCVSLSLGPIREREERALDSLHEGLRRRAESLIERQRLELNLLERTASLHDPRPWLEKGWIFAKGPDGKLVRSIDEISASDVLTLQFKDGQAAVRVESTSKGNAKE